MLLDRLLRDSLLLEGEPDGAGAASSAAPSVADPPADGQQAAPDPASVPADGAIPPEGEPAPEGETAPAGDDAAAPAALSAEDWKELIAAHPDQFQEAIKAVTQVKEEPTPTALQPRPNPLRESVATAGREAAARMQTVSRGLASGDLTELPESFMADVESFGSWTNAEAEGRQLDLAERLFERTLGIDPAKFDESDPIQARYSDALDKRAQEHINAFREFNKVYREPDPAKRAAILARAEQRQATATAAFLLERDALLVEHGKKLGSAETEKTAGKRIETTVDTAKKNGRTEAEAKAQAALQARRATATAAINGNANTNMGLPEFQAMDAATTVTFKKDHPAEYSRLLRLSNGMTED